jgi:predicted dehydrogenase
MRFALVGTHPHGVEMACALAESGRHELIAYSSAEPVPDPVRRRWGEAARRLHDLEEMLADPAVEAVIVAGSPTNRPAQLRRALQSERHVLCVHPADDSPNVAYEAAMLQQDTGRVLFPLLPEARHPAVLRLAGLAQSGGRPLVSVRVIEVERWSREEVLVGAGTGTQRPSFPGWDTLRVLGGEVVEVSGVTSREDLEGGQPVLLAGRFEGGGLYQVSALPYQHEDRCRVTAVGSHGRAELLFPQGVGGAAFLTWRGGDGEWHEEAWDAWDPWPGLVSAFEEAVRRGAAADWQDEVRCLELDDAARRSVQRRRSSTLDYQEATEEVGFKGTMTLVGCGLIWVTILIVILANWFPRLGWLVVPLLIVFLGMQVFRWIIPRRGQREGQGGERGRR